MQQPEPPADVFGFRPERFLRRRAQLGITQESLAATVGYERQVSISGIERGVSQPSVDKLVAIATALECSIDWLLGVGPDDLYEHGDLSESLEQMLPFMANATDEDWRKLIDTVSGLRTNWRSSPDSDRTSVRQTRRAEISTDERRDHDDRGGAAQSGGW